MSWIEFMRPTKVSLNEERERAGTAVWWPGLRRQLEEFVKKCPTCIKQYVNTAEQAIPSELPDRPWQKVASDLFELKNQHYLLVMDYFSWYVEIAKLSHITSPDIVVHLKSMFARHGILDQLLSDNGPQFSANTFSKFQEEFGFTSNPRFPVWSTPLVSLKKSTRSGREIRVPESVRE